jgi:cytochrome c
MRRHKIVLWAFAMLPVSDLMAQDADLHRGAELYRGCIGCHSLEPGAHMTGPSLAGLWGREAGKVAGFTRYSPAMQEASFIWDGAALDAWLANPDGMVPGTYMPAPGLEDAADRADLIVFLSRALVEGGHETVVEEGLIAAWYVRGQQPDPLTPTANAALVTSIRHCGDSYFITTADGRETPHWEMNVRLKVDTRATGPDPGRPVVAGAGMVGDRVSVIFSSIDDLETFVHEGC